MLIELLAPKEGDDTWRIKVHPKGGPSLPLSTVIVLWTPTKDVVTELRKMFPKNSGAMIKSATGEVLHPRPPGGYPMLHSSQRSRG